MIMIEQFLKTNHRWSPLIIRITLALVLFPHGAQKMLGWFGGFGFTGTMEYFTATVGIPWIIGLLVILIEFVGPLLLVAGVFTRATAAAIFGLFVGIILTSHIQHGFFMNWFGQLEPGQEGFEFHLLVIGIATALALSGPAKYALDTMLLKKFKSTHILRKY
jgi:putative oxidoreductase